MFIEELYVCGVYFDIFVEEYTAGTPDIYNPNTQQWDVGDSPEFSWSVDTAYIRDKDGKFMEIPDDLYVYLIEDSYIYNLIDEEAFSKFQDNLNRGF